MIISETNWSLYHIPNVIITSLWKTFYGRLFYIHTFQVTTLLLCSVKTFFDIESYSFIHLPLEPTFFGRLKPT